MMLTNSAKLFLTVVIAIVSMGYLARPAIAQFWLIDGSPADASADGSIVVGDNNATGQYFEWTSSGGMVDIGGVTAGSGVGGRPQISDDGSRVSGTNFNSASGFHEISYYERGTGVWTSVGGIGAACSTEISSGWGISGDGNHIVGLGWLGCADARAVQWTNGGSVSDLGSSVPNQSSRANAVNSDGSVVVGWQDGAGRNAAIWSGGTQIVLAGTGEASDVSSDGQVVVGIGSFGTVVDDFPQAWRWTASDGVETLGATLPGGPFPGLQGLATGITADGSLIVGFDRGGVGPFAPSQGWVWQEGTGIQPIGDYFAGFGIVQPGFNYRSVFGVSADGQTFFGVGTEGQSLFSVGWIVRVPEPASGLLTLLGAVLFSSLRGRRSR